jgi:hypothetical protein
MESQSRRLYDLSWEGPGLGIEHVELRAGLLLAEDEDPVE